MNLSRRSSSRLTLAALLTATTALVIAIPSSLAAPNPTPNKQMKEILDELQSKNGKPIESLSAAEARNQPTPADAVKSLLVKKGKKTDPEKLAKAEDRKIPGAAGEISARIYTPEGKGPFPVIVYYHGGGFVIATNDVYDASPRAIANQADAIVVSPEYRKSPESKFPAAHEDGYAAYQWVVKNAATFGGDPTKVAVAGESAGGNLAVNVAIRARDEKFIPPMHILAVYPIASADMNTPSYQANANAKPLNKAMMAWFTEQYLSSKDQGKDPRISLVKANLRGLPETTIITAEIDPLQSDGKMLSDEMRKAGVKVNYKQYKGVTHEFFGMASVLDEAKDAQKFGGKKLKASLH